MLNLLTVCDTSFLRCHFQLVADSCSEHYKWRHVLYRVRQTSQSTCARTALHCSSSLRVPDVKHFRLHVWLLSHALESHFQYFVTESTLPLSLTYIQPLSCARGLFSHPLLSRQPVCTEHASTIWRPQYSRWLPNLGLSDNYPESEGQKSVMAPWYAIRDVKLPYARLKWKSLHLLAIYNSIREVLHYLGTVPNTSSKGLTGS
jgi:hypothetical protein